MAEEVRGERGGGEINTALEGKGQFIPGHHISSYFFEQIIRLQNNFSSQSWVNLDETVLRCDYRICLTFPTTLPYDRRRSRIADRRKSCDRLRSYGNTLLRSPAILRSCIPVTGRKIKNP